MRSRPRVILINFQAASIRNPLLAELGARDLPTVEVAADADLAAACAQHRPVAAVLLCSERSDELSQRVLSGLDRAICAAPVFVVAPSIEPADYHDYAQRSVRGCYSLAEPAERIARAVEIAMRR